MTRQYDFELTFKLKQNEDPVQYMDALFEAGCDDACFGIGKPGYISGDFHRDATTAVSAIKSAIDGVLTAIPHAKIYKAGPEVQNIADMACIFDCSKQNLNKHANGLTKASEPFPDAYIIARISYFKTLDVALWLRKYAPRLSITDEMIEVYQDVQAINRLIDSLKSPTLDTKKYAFLKKVA